MPRIHGALGSVRATTAGVKKIPPPMMPPTTIIAAEKSPSSRRSSPARGARGGVAPCGPATRAVVIARASDDDQVALILARRDDGFTVRDVRVHLAAHPDVARDVDAGLDREADLRHETPLLARLEVVDVRSGAVQIAHVDRMPGTMREILI